MKQVIITVDTEGHKGKDPVSKLIFGETGDGGQYGIQRIMDICDQCSAKALFFVDIAEAWDYGKEKVAKVIKYINEKGHDVGVHVHPDHMSDKKRLFLWEYSKEEQFYIIKSCTDLYREITGKNPIAFRAGKYGANRDTLDILSSLGYKFDFSQFYGQKQCGIAPPVAVSLPQKYKNIIEIPVTVFNSIQLGKKKRFDKIDVEMHYPEYVHIMNQIAKDRRNIIITLFGHSFSFLDWRDDPDNPKFDSTSENRFIKMLNYVHESKEFVFASQNDLQTSTFEDDLMEDTINTKGFIRRLWYLIVRIYSIRKYNTKAKLILLALILLILICISFIIFIISIISIISIL